MVRIEVDWAPPKIGGNGGASSRNPPQAQERLFESAVPASPVVVQEDAGKAYLEQLLDFFRGKGRKTPPLSYEADLMSGPDSQGDKTKGFGGQVGCGSPPQE